MNYLLDVSKISLVAASLTEDNLGTAKLKIGIHPWFLLLLHSQKQNTINYNTGVKGGIVSSIQYEWYLVKIQKDTKTNIRSK